MVKKKQKHHEKKDSEPSRLSGLVGRLSGFLKEAVQPPPEEEKQFSTPEEIEEKYEETLMATHKEPEPADEEIDEEELVTTRRDEQRSEILDNLNSATQKWKETGDLGIKLEAPVPLRERVQKFVHRVKNSALSAKLKKQFDEVLDKVRKRVKKAEQSGQKVNEDQLVKEEWAEVLKRVEKSGDKNEREEIEKIYKELEGK